MRKDLKKNKKGFTLVEIIVVLLIIGILLAITIPSIMGYVNKAKEAQYIADARTGFVAAQTISANKAVTANKKGKDLAEEITITSVKEELGETGTPTVESIFCTVENGGTALKKCSIRVNGMPADKFVNFEAKKDAVISDTPTVTAAAAE